MHYGVSEATNCLPQPETKACLGLQVDGTPRRSSLGLAKARERRKGLIVNVVTCN